MIDFNKMTNEFLEREQKPKKIGRYYPSEIGMCIRKVWYSYKFPKEIDEKLTRIFHAGNMVHDFVVEVLQSEKTSQADLKESELPFKEMIDDFVISGRIDNLIVLKSNGEDVLVEVKSTGNIDYVKEAKPENISQLQLYMYHFKIPKGILLYVNKNDLSSKVFNVEYSEKDALSVIDRFKALNNMLKNDIIPKPEAREDRKTMWMCKFCEYRKDCYDETPSSSEFL